jgi:hypothetical protein
VALRACVAYIHLYPRSVTVFLWGEGRKLCLQYLPSIVFSLSFLGEYGIRGVAVFIWDIREGKGGGNEADLSCLFLLQQIVGLVNTSVLVFLTTY